MVGPRHLKVQRSPARHQSCLGSLLFRRHRHHTKLVQRSGAIPSRAHRVTCFKEGCAAGTQVACLHNHHKAGDIPGRADVDGRRYRSGRPRCRAWLTSFGYGAAIGCIKVVSRGGPRLTSAAAVLGRGPRVPPPPLARRRRRPAAAPGLWVASGRHKQKLRGRRPPLGAGAVWSAQD